MKKQLLLPVILFVFSVVLFSAAMLLYIRQEPEDTLAPTSVQQPDVVAYAEDNAVVEEQDTAHAESTSVSDTDKYYTLDDLKTAQSYQELWERLDIEKLKLDDPNYATLWHSADTDEVYYNDFRMTETGVFFDYRYMPWPIDYNTIIEENFNEWFPDGKIDTCVFIRDLDNDNSTNFCFVIRGVDYYIDVDPYIMGE